MKGDAVRRMLMVLMVTALLLVRRGEAVDDINTISKKIYTTLPDFPCVRLLDNDSRFGCSSRLRGVTAPILYFENLFDVTDYVSSPPSESHSLVMEAPLFTKENVDSIRSAISLTGIVVLDGTSAVDISHSSPFPNRKWSLHPDANFSWVPEGDGMNDAYYDFPITLISQNNSAYIRTIAKQNKLKSDGPRWALRLNYFMEAGIDVETCLRRYQCQPIGGQSLWGTFGRLNGSKPLILATATIDSTSLFHGQAPAASAEMAGSVALLSALKWLSDFSPQDFEKELLFGFFQNEAYGHAGTLRFVKDIRSFECRDYDNEENHCYTPWEFGHEFEEINFEQIEAVIGVGELGKKHMNGTSSVAFVHREHATVDLPRVETDALVASLLNLGSSPDISKFVIASTETPGVPPSSVVEFLKANLSLPSIVVADHFREFENRNYHSSFDRLESVDTDVLCQTSLALARALFSLANPSSSIPNDAMDCELVATLLNCLVFNLGCEVAIQFWDFHAGPHTHYTGVYRENHVDEPTYFIEKYLKNVTSIPSNTSCDTDGDCDGDDICFMKICRNSGVHYHPALSPAFEYHRPTFWEGGGWWFNDREGKFPGFAESNWPNDIGLSFFKVGNSSLETLHLVIGISLVIIFTLLIVLLKKHFLGYALWPKAPKEHVQ